MAVIVEGYSVIVRNSTLAAKYPGGMEGYRRDCPNATFCSDAHLSRIGFMVHRDADVFVAQLAARGLMPYRKDVSEDIALVCQSDGLLRPCGWLELGRYRGASIAWLAGEERGDLHAPPGWTPERPLEHRSAEEARRRLEFVRSDGNVDLYRDKATGQEYYAGRTGSAATPDLSRHDDLYRQACGLIEGLILLDDRVPGQLDDGGRERLRGPIPILAEVVEINPNNWAAMWLLGKVYQRLGDQQSGLPWFSRAHRVNPEHPDVAREAAIAAMEVGRPEDAVIYCERALEAKPDDPGLQANMALALLFSGKPGDARTVAGEALRKDPADEITARIVGFIDEVLAGARPCPRHVRDLEEAD
jgi:tetratricopeptide (TPR) repeat protein